MTHSVPGVVVAHSPKSSGRYIGSPGLTICPDGSYLASHDFFGPQSDEWSRPATEMYRSIDCGKSWRQAATLKGLFWANLFVLDGAVYAMGVDRHHGRLVIRRSDDGGTSWTTAHDEHSGLLTRRANYHTAPVPVIHHEGRIWRAVEDASFGEHWGTRYGAVMLSAPLDSDLLIAHNWSFSAALPRDPSWLEGRFQGWLEGNAVVDPAGRIVNVLRVDVPHGPEKAALVYWDPHHQRLHFDASSGFIDFPGGAKKFTLRFDAVSASYLALANVAPVSEQKAKPSQIRNTLALISSPDLREWRIHSTILLHPDPKHHGFQYVDWHIDGDDLVALCRTAYDDGQGGAHNYHDANYLTFHRIAHFRDMLN